ncbi:AMP-binding protein [Sneathiella sp. HT1-7]|uniref:AMP-binding protein n=1 Tax=Sneathiella sp. HT1-7 TaxID=2887192 RepID=UPI001D14BF5F|nr:AMP-binding protein [Sneathiella sp. HT1-7]MCC3306376.1 AMP-binding protein [Sneathiella sp. HT1-7]
MINLSSFLKYHAERWPDNIAIVYEDRRISYAELWERVRQLARYMTEQGIGRGDVVAAFMKNSPAFLEISFASSYLGAVFLPINYRLATDEIAYIVGNAEASILFGDEEFADILKLDVPVRLLDEEMQKDISILTGWGEAIPPQAYVKPDDLFRLMYTSGTTDRPKGVMHSYQNFYWKSMEHVVVLGLSRETRLLVTGPLYHVGAYDLPGVAVLWLGGMLKIHREYDPLEVLAGIEAEKLNGAWLAPVMLSGILGHPEREKYEVSSLEWCIGGGEKTPEGRIREFQDYFKNGRYIDAYGLTESCSGDTFMEPGWEIKKIGSTGRATPHVSIRITDEEGASLNAGEEGEICLLGPKVAEGYWKDPEKTAETRHGDWFRTGDVGYLDDDGFLYLTDRMKDIIISGGENIASSEIERVIYQMPGVLETAVIGIPDSRWGEVPIAVVVMENEEKLNEQELEAHCREHLAGFKVPKHFILRETLPRNPSGKILKRVLRDQISVCSLVNGK